MLLSLLALILLAPLSYVKSLELLPLRVVEKWNDI